jgi:hypothetical protein
MKGCGIREERKMAALYTTVKNEAGSALLLVMLVLALVTFIGIAATRTSNVEMLIGGNDRQQKVAFYAAEGGTQVAIELIADNIDCGGFADVGEGVFEEGDVRGPSLNLFMNEPPDSACLGDPDAFFPKDYAGADPRTYLNMGGVTRQLPGGAIEMFSGTKRKGRSAASGGAARLYDIYSQHEGPRNSDGRVMIQWQYILN